MICYKFKYKGEDAPAQMIKTPCGSSIYLGIFLISGETVVLSDGVNSTTITATSDGYLAFSKTTPSTPSVTNYTATITGTVNEESYTHTIRIKVISSIVSYGDIMEGQG